MNRKELFDYADALVLPPSDVRPLLTAIREATVASDYTRQRLRLLTSLMEANDFDDAAPGDVASAALAYEQAAAKKQTLFLTLACVLQNAGHKIDF